MKKIILLATLAILLKLPITVIYAAETSDLQTLANSLGADTDYLNIPNFKHDDEERKILYSSYLSYFNTCSNYEALIYPDYYFSKSLKKGACYGISTLEILAHNGLITPSDILEGASKMNEIEYSEPVDHFVAGYHAMQCHYESLYAMYSMALNCTAKEQTDILINTAESCMDKKKYFSIACYTSNSGHQIVGIGIADGNWEFNGKSYDKCILTLDSNNTDDNGNAVPFQEDTCIYANSAEGKIYIPKYDYSSDDDLIISVISDDSLLNHKGLISPTDKYETDLSSSNIVTLWYEPQIKYDIKAYNADGNMVKLSETGNKIKQFMSSYTYMMEGKKFHIEPDTEDKDIHSQKLRIQNLSGGYDFYIQNDLGIFDIGEKEFSIASKNKKAVNYWMILRFNEGYYPFSPHYDYYFLGKTDSYIKAEVIENGILLSSDTVIETEIETNDVLYNENNIHTDMNYNKINTQITADNGILLSFDKNNRLEFFIDPDNDGIYDTAVEKGDTNSDGIIDARDATAVLTAYSTQSVSSESKLWSEGKVYINTDISDIDGNGILDGRDATTILTQYAENSVHQDGGA